MFKAFISELKSLCSTRWRISSFILLLFIPLVYAGFFMSGFWAPMHNMDKLNIKIISLDKSTISNIIAQDLSKTKIDIHSGTREYQLTLKLSTIYKSNDEIKNDVDQGKIDAAFVIPKLYKNHIISSLDSHLDQYVKGILNYLNNKPNPTELLMYCVSHIPNLNLPKLDFFNSYKNNFLTGELTNLVANTDALKSAIINNLFKNISSSQGTIIQAINKIIDDKFQSHPKIKKLLKKIIAKTFTYLGFHSFVNNDILSGLITHKDIGSNIDSYGKGISPYFFSIAIWAGMLVAIFVLKNERSRGQRKNNTFLNYFSKTLVWIMTSWLQATFLWIFVVIFWSINSGSDVALFFRTYAYMLFLSLMFAMIIQAITFSFRLSELGSLFAVILLITQLVSSSGTFPVEMQNIIFRIFNYIAPFSYSVASFRELLFEPNITHLLLLQLPILLFLLLIPISLYVNYRFDKKYFEKHKEYCSYVIEFNDE